MRIGKILGFVVGGLIALVAIVLLAVWLLVNPNDYKPRIQAAVKQATGRDLKLPGDIKLSVFPWIALQLGPASLGNPAGFSDQPFLSFQHADARVKLLPLLGKRLEVGHLEIDGLDVRLIKNDAGKGNWQGFGSSSQPAPATPAAKPVGASASLEGIAGIKVSNARVSYGTITVQNINLETATFADKQVVPITLHVDADRGTATEHASLDVKLDLTPDSAAERYRIDALNLSSDVSLAGNPRPVRIVVSAPSIDVNLQGQTLSMPKFDVTAAGAHLTGGVEGTQIVDALNLKGSVQLAALLIREFLPRLSMTAPVTRDPKALSSVAFSSGFSYGGNAAHLDELQVTLDDTTLKGNAAIVNLDTDALTFALAVDKIDLDRYLAPANQPPAPAPAATPQEAAKPLDANGTLTVGSLHVSLLDLSNVLVTVATKDKVLHVFPLKAEVDGGQYSGDVTLDSRSTIPTLSLDEHLTGIDVGKLLAAESQKMHVTGHGNVAIKATAHGAAADAIMKTLNGHFDLNVTGGALQGIDLGYQIGRAEALLKRQDTSATDSHATKFDALKMSAEIVNGIATTKDLLISSAVLKVTGQGSANLPTEAIDFSLLVDTLHSARSTSLQIPVKVTGNFANPTVRPDVEALAKGQIKQKVQSVLQDKLKGLFGKP
jgi:AsmA protein